MKVNLKNPYGYKICYTKKGNKNHLIDDFHIHTYRTAQDTKSWRMRVHKHKKNKLTFYVLPITKKEVTNGIWKYPF